MDVGDLMLIDIILAEGSLTAAAERLGQPKSTVSRRLQRLEAALGAQLFDRAGRRLRPTPLVQGFAGPAAAVRLAFAQAQSVAAAARFGHGAPLRVTTPYLFGRLVMLPAITRLAATDPTARLKLEYRNDAVDPLREGVDMAIRAQPPREAYLHSVRLARAALQLYASPALLARHPVRSPADLAGLPYVHTSNDHPASIVLRLAAGSQLHEVAVQVAATVNDPEAACRLTADGRGVAALPRFLARDLVADGSLAEVLPGFTPGTVDLFAITAPGRTKLPAVRRLLGAIRHVIAETRFAA